MCSKKGFTLIEVFLALFIFNLSILLWLNLFKSLEHFDSRIDERQNFIGLNQLRRIVALGKEFEVNGFELCMNYRDEEVCFYENDHRLIQTPGTQIYLLNIRDVSFELKDGFIWMNYLFADSLIEVIVGFI